MNAIKTDTDAKFAFTERNQMLPAMSEKRRAQRTDMLKTLRITSVLAVLLATVFLVLPAVFGVRRDEGAEQFLSAPGATEQFNRAKGQKTSGGEGQVSPLVKEAEAFALYLNPPKPKTPPRQAVREGGVSAPRPPVISAKFNLIGTSYYALRPELSLALIDEPGKGFHWVRQSGKVGHLIIEKIQDGLVVVLDGKRTYELEVERPKKRSLVKGSVSDARITSTEPSPIREEEKQLLGKMADGVYVVPPPPPLPGQVYRQGAKEVISEAGARHRSLEETRAEKLLAELEAMRVGDEEARRLGRLGKKLEEAQQEPNRAPDDGTQNDPN